MCFPSSYRKRESREHVVGGLLSFLEVGNRVTLRFGSATLGVTCHGSFCRLSSQISFPSECLIMRQFVR